MYRVEDSSLGGGPGQRQREREREQRLNRHSIKENPLQHHKI